MDYGQIRRKGKSYQILPEVQKRGCEGCFFINKECPTLFKALCQEAGVIFKRLKKRNK